MRSDRQVVIAKTRLDTRASAIAEPAKISGVFLYKLGGKMFAILSMRDDAAVSLKCDPYRADVLRELYTDIGHRYHLDRRHWISITLDGDVPDDEIERLIDHSYDLVMAKLSRAQRAVLEPM